MSAFKAFCLSVTIYGQISQSNATLLRRQLTSALTTLHRAGLSEMTALIPHLAHSFMSSLSLTVQAQIHLPAALASERNLTPSADARHSNLTEKPWQWSKKYLRASGMDIEMAYLGR